jgi:hypothetical protein
MDNSRDSGDSGWWFVKVIVMVFISVNIKQMRRISGHAGAPGKEHISLSTCSANKIIFLIKTIRNQLSIPPPHCIAAQFAEPPARVGTQQIALNRCQQSFYVVAICRTCMVRKTASCVLMNGILIQVLQFSHYCLRFWKVTLPLSLVVNTNDFAGSDHPNWFLL